MRRSITFCLLLVSLATSARGALAGAKPSIDQALAQVAADPHAKPTTERFHFVIMGDSRTPYQYADAIGEGKLKPFQPQEFRLALTEAGVLGSAFIVDVGDLILGYGSPAVVQAEWDDYLATISQSAVPLISLPGNHDVFDAASEEIWRRRLGPLYFSFDYGPSHFICLNSEQSATLDSLTDGFISQEQVDWLKQDLEAHRAAKSVFVLLHRPFFDAAEFPKNNWGEVHALLKQYPVRMVVAGHLHVYRRYAPRDGIEYLLSGGGGAEVEGPPELGSFHHYLLVDVDGAAVHWAVVKPGSVLAPDVVTEELVKEAEAAPKRTD